MNGVYVRFGREKGAIQSFHRPLIIKCSGMQITLPSPDGQNQIITGPYQIKMQLAHNSSPPIQGTEGLTKKEHS